jgi:small-conductance mechanosensitive channel
VQTFFQSGVFEWAERQEIAGDWFFRTDVFGLFMAICVPMTILTLCFWLVMNTLARMKARKKLSEDRTVVEAVARPQVTPV